MPSRLLQAAGPTFPNALNTGASGALTTLTPGTAYHSAGGSGGTLVGGINTGWSLSSAIPPAWTTSANAVIDSLSMTYPIVISSHNGVTVSNSSIIIDGANPSFNYAIDLAGTAANTTVRNCTIGAVNAGDNRVEYAINGATDPYLTVTGCNIYYFRVAASITNGLFQGNYVHDPGYFAGDHTDGISCLGNNGATSFATGLQILGNTIIMQINQTSPLDIGSTASPCQYILIEGNLLAGGGYGLYGGITTTDTQHTHSSCTINGGSLTTVLDGSAVAADVGATITGANVPAGTTITGYTLSTSYTISQAGTAGSGLSFLITQTSKSSRADTGCATNSTATVTDSSVIPSDVGATVTGTNIPASTTITSLTGTYPGYTGFVMSQAATGTGSGLTLTLHYTNNIQVLNNRFSQMYYPLCGTFGTHADYDTAVASNIWTNNVVHDTGAQIPA